MTPLERITELARKIFEVRVSMVWLKREHTETTSLSAQVALTSEALVIEDTRGEEIKAEDIEADQEIRFYAGVPLLSPDGPAMGTLCIMDHKPRRFDSAELALLKDLAELVMDQMKLRLTGEALQAANEKLAHQATHDALTGLPNRAFFDRTLEVALEQATRSQGRFAILYMDLNGFKQINDRFGHRTGDVLLQQVSERLMKIVQRGATLARLGGDEFVLLLPHVKDKKEAAMVAAAIHCVMEGAFQIEGNEIIVRASAGCSLFPDDGETARQLLHNADSHMYRSKQVADRYNSPDVSSHSVSLPREECVRAAQAAG